MTRLAALCFAGAGAAASAALLSLGGCFSERVAGSGPPGGDLCEGSPANVVQIRDFAFSPAQLSVARGTRVTWVNCDPVSHTSTADAGGWNSGLLAPGTAYERTFDAAGSFAYHCDPHPAMRGSVVVAP